MGYESRIYVVEKHCDSIMLDKNANKFWADKIAEFDMSCMCGFGGLFKTETDCYLYDDDGNTAILEDKYRNPLTEASVDEVIAYLEDFEANKDFYRRIHSLLSFLKGIDQTQWRNLVVLHYGY